MKKHFKKFIDFLLFGIPLIIRVLLKLKRIINIIPYIRKECKWCKTSTRPLSKEGFCEICHDELREEGVHSLEFQEQEISEKHSKGGCSK